MINLNTVIVFIDKMAVDDDIIRKNPAKNAMSAEFGREAKKKEMEAKKAAALEAKKGAKAV